MSMDITVLSTSTLARKLAAEQTLACNAFTEPFGLTLTKQDATALVATRGAALQSFGRVEFGAGVVEKLIYAFCDSPYITQDNYAETLHALIACFYYYKNKTLDLLSDDELVEFMQTRFNTICEGSITLLQETYMEQMAATVREQGFYNPEDFAL